MIVEFRRHTLLPLDDVLGGLRKAIPRRTETDQRSESGVICSIASAASTASNTAHQAYHPWTNGQAQRMNRTIKDATIKAFHYDSLASLKAHVVAFGAAYNFAKHLKALRWRAPFEAICEAWPKDPLPFKINPHHLSAGPNT